MWDSSKVPSSKSLIPNGFPRVPRPTSNRVGQWDTSVGQGQWDTGGTVGRKQHNGGAGKSVGS